jgi:hypothetical protein
LLAKGVPSSDLPSSLLMNFLIIFTYVTPIIP